MSKRTQELTEKLDHIHSTLEKIKKQHEKLYEMTYNMKGITVLHLFRNDSESKYRYRFTLCRQHNSKKREESYHMKGYSSIYQTSYDPKHNNLYKSIINNLENMIDSNLYAFNIKNGFSESDLVHEIINLE